MKNNGTFGFVDNLAMTYDGNMLTSVRDDAHRSVYAGAMDFDGVPGQEYPLTYNDAGSLTSDAGRRIAWIDYDLFGMPVRIQFTNGHVTEHVYTSEGEKLKTIHRTAVPNISISLNSTLTLNGSNTLGVDSTDYIGSFVFEQGALNKYLFAGGYFTLSGVTPVYHY